MFRAYITKYTREFDAKHDLIKLYEKSLIASNLDEDEKAKFSTAVKTAHDVWRNDLRYSSPVRMKRLLGHEIAKGNKDINKFLNQYYSDYFSAVETILEKGKKLWT